MDGWLGGWVSGLGVCDWELEVDGVGMMGMADWGMGGRMGGRVERVGG